VCDKDTNLSQQQAEDGAGAGPLLTQQTASVGASVGHGLALLAVGGGHSIEEQVCGKPSNDATVMIQYNDHRN
jgi:hypothetical protein